jgi:phage terminase large subunit-like protein
MIPTRQGFQTLSAPTKRLLELVLAGRIRHGGDPVLRWMADNLMVRQDPAGNVKPDKAKSRQRIDGVVALVMALDRANRWRDQPPSAPLAFDIDL